MIAKKTAYLVLLATLGSFLTGCEEPPLKPSSHWFPKSIAGPIEIRPLPPATMLQNDYSQWLASSSGPKVRLYEMVPRSSSEQSNLQADISKGKTPVGKRTGTFISFTYSNSTNGSYQLEWMEAGRQNVDFIRFGGEPKKFLLRLIQIRDVPVPRLQIVAIEGVESRGVLVATEDKSLP